MDDGFDGILISDPKLPWVARDLGAKLPAFAIVGKNADIGFVPEEFADRFSKPRSSLAIHDPTPVELSGNGRLRFVTEILAENSFHDFDLIRRSGAELDVVGEQRLALADRQNTLRSALIIDETSLQRVSGRAAHFEAATRQSD